MRAQWGSYRREPVTPAGTSAIPGGIPAERIGDLDSVWLKAAKSRSGSIDVVDLFSGCGGMSAGFKSLNGLFPAYRVVGAVDVDETANATYQTNIGVAPVVADVATLAKRPAVLGKLLGAALSEQRRRKLVLIGCAPCQGFSSHRNQLGEADSRNSLFLDFIAIAVRLKPEAVVVENVPEILTDRYYYLVAHARASLEAAGYFVHVSAHNMASFGVPQERFRAVLIALRNPFRPLVPPLRRENFRTVRDAIGQLRPIAAGVQDPLDAMHVTAAHRKSTLATMRAVPLDGGSRPDNVGPECLRRAKARYGKAIYEDVYGRLAWDKPAITITAHARNPASGRFVHPEQHRGLSIREAALLQGFPSRYRFSGSLDAQFRQIGNAVPPVFSAHLAAHLFIELGGARRRVQDFDPGITSSVGPSFSRLIPSLKEQTS